jgi:hypothetical protein
MLGYFLILVACASIIGAVVWIYDYINDNL